MSGVSAASDIWSVGCTVIELLTCVPPYYDLQPMPALFRIVQVWKVSIIFLYLSFLRNGTFAWEMVLWKQTQMSLLCNLHEGSHIPQESHCNSPEKWRFCFDCWQDDHPPLPEHVSPAITDFLDQCFRKVKLFLALALEIKHLSDSHLHFSFGEVLISGHCLKLLLMVSSTLLSKQIVPAFLVFWFRCGIS